MITIYDLKPAFQKLLRPLCQRLVNWNITANQVTIAAVLLSLGMGAAIAWQPHVQSLLLLLPIVLFVRMALNAIDGMLAREHDMKTPLGAILNELGDVVADAGLYLPFALLVNVMPILVVLVVLLAIISEMTGVIAVQIGASRRYDGPMGKSDRAFIFGLIALLLGLGISLGMWINLIFILMIGLLIVTIFNRAFHAIKEVQNV
jgi:CDP-diacylglycerol--glycerol-3-phosphate 3-phosphatidyltransferase